MHEYWSNLTQSRQYTIVGLSSMQWIDQYAHNLKHGGVRRYFDPPIYWPRGQYILRYFDPGVNIS